MRKHAFTLVSIFLLFVLGESRQAAADEVTKWNETATRVAFDTGLSAPLGNPIFDSRVNAMTHAAIHDALNAINRLYRPYAFDQHGRRARPPKRP